LKPENILIDIEGHIRLADFGLAKQGGDSSKVIAQSFCGSPAYLAPEMLRKEGVTQSCDVY
jgi:serine/threonine protein kinase